MSTFNRNPFDTRRLIEENRKRLSQPSRPDMSQLPPRGPVVPAGQPLTTRVPSERANPAAVVGTLPMRRESGSIQPIPTAKPSAQSDGLQELGRRDMAKMGPPASLAGPAPEPMGPPAPKATDPRDLALLDRRERELRMQGMAFKRLRLAQSGLSPGFTVERAEEANQEALRRANLRDVVRLQREERPEEARDPAAITASRDNLRGQALDFAQRQLEAAVPAERLAAIRSGAALDISPEEKAALDEFDRIVTGTRENLPGLSQQQASAQSLRELAGIRDRNERIRSERESLLAPGSTFTEAERQRTVREGLGRLAEQNARARIEADTAQAHQTAREAGGTGPTGAIQEAEQELDVAAANRARALTRAGAVDPAEFEAEAKRIEDQFRELAPGILDPVAFQMTPRATLAIANLANRAAALEQAAEVDPAATATMAVTLIGALPRVYQTGFQFDPLRPQDEAAHAQFNQAVQTLRRLAGAA